MKADDEHWTRGGGKTAELGPRRRRNGPGARRSVAWYLASLAICSAPALAKADAGTSSSASIRISVSVAAHHQLRAAMEPSTDGLKRAGPGLYCIETNGQAMPLPVMLVWPVARDASTSQGSGEEQAAEVPACGAPHGKAIVRGETLASPAVIVRPE